MRRFAKVSAFFIMVAGLCLAYVPQVSAFNPNRIIDDGIFSNSGSMSASDIDAFLNARSSCISPNSGFSAIDPIGYSPSSGFRYGGNVSAGTVVAHAAQAYDLNPQVLLTTLQKEQSLLTSTDCSTNTLSKAAGYGCPDGGTSYSYSNVNLYTRNGTTYTSVNGICVNSSAKAGFSQQVIRAAWLLKFGQQRSLGNTGWAIIRGDWDNSDDLNSCYGGPVTQGWRSNCPNSQPVYYDGYKSIDDTAVHMDTGATAALYWYTPHLHGNQNFRSIFIQWFGNPVYASDVSKEPAFQAPANTVRKLSGNWIGDGKEDIAYVTRRASGGFDLAMFESTGSGDLAWRGVWWSSDSLPFDTTAFIPADVDGDGYTDLLYATPAPGGQGFDVALMRNNGDGFSYLGQKWNPRAGFSLNDTKFISGNWSGDSKQDIAYVTKRASGGFDVAVFESLGSGTWDWKGVKWSAPSSLNFDSANFIPADVDGDGYTDLLYATPANGGIDVALMHNNGSSLTYYGQQWNPRNPWINTGNVKFISGNWSGDSKQDIAYVTKRFSGGYDVAIFESTGSGLVWRGVWWSSDSLPFDTTAFIPADVDGDARTDLFYATPAIEGFDLALMHNNGAGVDYYGHKWNAPYTFSLGKTRFP